MITAQELAEKYRGATIAIIGNGPSGHADFGDIEYPIWTCNGGWERIKNVELGWVMDDIHGPALRSMSNYDIPDPNYADHPLSILEAPVPIVTSCAYREQYPDNRNLIEFPLEDVLRYYGMTKDGSEPYFDETINYMVAWAIMIGVRKIFLFGCDYQGVRPSERASLEFWCGFARGRGIGIGFSRWSHTLKTQDLDGINRHVPGIYGYLPQNVPVPYETKPDGSVRFQI